MTLVESHGLANRPGEPYPATFRNCSGPTGNRTRISACRAGVVPLDHEPTIAVDRPGIEPRLRCTRIVVQPQHLTDRRDCPSDPGWPDRSHSRISNWLVLTQASSPLDHGIKSVTEVGVEPTEHEALDLAALPVCVPGHVQVAGPGVAPGGPGL